MPKIYLYGGSFNPPGLHHEAIARFISNRCNLNDRFIVMPCGKRPDKETTNDLSSIHRATMCDLAFGSIPRVEVDLTDLEKSQFTRTWDLDKKMRKQFPRHEIVHVIGADIVAGGARGESEIHQTWFRGNDVWNKLRFLVQHRDGVTFSEQDLPPHATATDPKISGSSSLIRERIFKHEPFDDLVSPNVGAYIKRHHLFTGRVSEGTGTLMRPFRPIVLFDETKQNAVTMAKQLKAVALDDPSANCIIVIGGDGFMLRAIRTHWRRRLPFFGVNAGTIGFLLNELPLLSVSKHLADYGGMRTHIQQLLFVEYETTDGEMRTDIAFNDALLERSTPQTAWMRLCINGEVAYEQHKRMMGDGLLVSTAAGSTGYARAMGATPLMIGTPMMVIAGSNICSHTWRAAQVSIRTECEIEALDTDKRPVRAVIDGRDCGSVTRMRVRTSNIASAELAFLPETDLAQKISRLQFSSRD